MARRERTLTDWLQMLRDGWAALLLAIALGIGIGLAVSARQPTRFAAVGTVVVSSTSGFLDLATADKLPGATETIVRLARKPAVLRAAAAAFAETAKFREPPPTIGWMRSHLTIGEVANLSIIEIEGKADSQAAATALTRSTTGALAGVVNRAAASIDNTQPTASGIVLRVFGPVEQTGQISPTRFRNVLIGGNAGLLIGIVIALVLGSLRPRLRKAADITELLDAPFLGWVRLSRRRGISTSDPGITQTSARLLAHETDSGGTALVLTGATSPNRLAKVAEALAQSLSASGRDTAVVDADLERRSFTSQLHLENHPGLTDILNGFPDLSRPGTAAAPASYVLDQSSLSVLPAGARSIDPAAALRRRRLPETIEALRAIHMRTNPSPSGPGSEGRQHPRRSPRASDVSVPPGSGSWNLGGGLEARAGDGVGAAHAAGSPTRTVSRLTFRSAAGSSAPTGSSRRTS